MPTELRTPQPHQVRPALPARVLDRLRDPMSRGAFALVVGSGLTSVLGLVFWTVAARTYPAADVGIAGALINAMAFLANLATLGLRNGMVRFLPVLGGRRRPFIVRSYLACSAAAVLAAVTFVGGQSWWAPDLGFVRSGPGAVVLFVVFTVAWVLFVLEDQVLTGLHRATWVPVSNLAYSVAKLLALVVLSWLGAWGLFVAWSLPAVVVVVVVTAMILRGPARSAAPAPVAPAPAADTLAGSGPVTGPPPPDEPLARGIIRFAVADHASAVLWLATTQLLPLVVLARAGADASAYYLLAFTIAYSLYLVTANVAAAFLAESAHHPDQAGPLLRRATADAMALVLPLTVVAVAVAPLGLRLLGPQYADHGVTLLRLLLLSAVPQVLIGLAVNVARLRRRLGLVIAIYAATAIGTFGGTLLALDRWGLDGVGWAWLTTQLVLAAVLLGTDLLRPLRPSPRPRPARVTPTP